MARRETIRVNGGTGKERVEVMALVFGELAVHKLLSNNGISIAMGGWRVVHVRSGLSLGQTLKLQRDARALAKRLQDRPEWAKVGEDGSYPDQVEFKALGAVVKETTREILHPEGSSS